MARPIAKRPIFLEPKTIGSREKSANRAQHRAKRRAKSGSRFRLRPEQRDPFL
jgi:hypothetical protein